MEREIKFRLWHIEDKQMYSYDFMWGRSGQSGSGWVDCVPFGEEREVGFFKHGNQIGIDPHDCEIMQYTGLKDKNGTEIYEGDIVKAHYSLPDIGYGSIDYSIQGDVLFSSEYGDWEVYGDRLYVADVVEVIGNIYQHPELLKEAVK
jgi:uncharacterized phage protein (TIGR01671 family)